MSKKAVRDILGTDRDSEFLQSFVRVGLNLDEDDDDEVKSNPTQQPKPDLFKQFSDGKSENSDKTPRRSRSSTSLLDSLKLRRRKPKEFFDEVYTDKDRAAAVSFGSYDIKQSLSIKRRQDRNEALQLPEEAEPGTLIALGMREIKSGNIDIAVSFISKALEMNPTDQIALVARSKCYLLLGEPAKALQDAETALIADKSNIRAVYQKAESLYFLGQFEHSLMFFHRGLRLRPELATFRLGVQKTQEAIENTIGAVPIAKAQKKNTARSDKSSCTSKISSVVEMKPRLKSSKVDSEKKTSRKLLGELCVDKEYLENLLKNPDLKRADKESENISKVARDAVNYLNNRQEFWRQQRPCTALPNQKKITASTPLPRWY